MKVVKRGYEGPKVKDTETFILKARWQHGDRYDYSKSVYTKSSEKLEIICTKHGSFFQRAACHNNNGAGCPSCKFETLSRVHSHDNDWFIKEARRIHGNKYNYSKVNYVNDRVKVEIICPEHGSFWQTPNGHIRKPSGCIKCGFERSASSCRSSKEEFIEDAIKLHGDKYDYSLVEYTNTDTKVILICPVHGKFEITPYHHVRREQGCTKCGNYRRGWTFNNPIYKSDDEESFLYIIKLINSETDEEFLKVGLSVSPEARHKQISKESGCESFLLYLLKGTGKKLHRAEREVLFRSPFNRYQPTVDFAGQSECFVSGQTRDMIDFIEEVYYG